MKVLIFSSSAGNGHNSTAKRLQEKILSKEPKSKIKIIDSYNAYASKLKAWIMEDGYFLACNHILPMYNFFFKQSEKSNFENRDKSNANKDSYCLMYGMLKEIYDFKPDIVISTYIFCSIALRNLKRYYEIPAPCVCMTLDYGISPYWECCAEGLDYMFLTGDYMVKPFKKLGYTDKQIVVSGIPVAEKFSSDLEKKETRIQMGLDPDLFTLIIMKASFFPISNKKIVKELKKIKNKIQVIIINGKNKKNYDEMTKLIAKNNLIHNIKNIGFTDKMVEYLKSSDLVLGKAGGLSTTECINSNTPSLIVDGLPQQEIYNKMYLIEHGCAVAVTKRSLASTIMDIASDKRKYNQLQKCTQKLSNPNTLEIIYNTISNLPTPDYSNLKLTDSKRQVIRNVNKKRLETIKSQKLESKSKKQTKKK